MKPHTLPVKRRPAPKGILKRLSAVTGNRKQRVAAAAAASEMESEDSSSKISRALTIIFLIHIVAIGLIFVHQKFLDGRSSEDPKATGKSKAEGVAAAAPAPRRADLPRLSTGEQTHIVSQGDNYARIAEELGVNEGDLRLVNDEVEIRPGLILKIPPKRIVAQDPPEIAAIRQQGSLESDRGLVENVDIANAPRAQLVRPNISQADSPRPTASGNSYVVKSGDSIWRIANRFKVNQETLMKANGITDARKMKVGMTLSIPK
jgi:LysM repeat protein